MNNHAIYWGKFDPPTIAHKKIIEIIWKKLLLSKLTIVINDFENQQYIFNSKFRKELLEILNFSPNLKYNIEILIQNSNNKYDYLYFKNSQKVKYVAICGADSYHNWSNIAKFYDQVIVFKRKDHLKNHYDENVILYNLPRKFQIVSASIAKKFLEKNQIHSWIPNEIRSHIYDYISKVRDIESI